MQEKRIADIFETQEDPVEYMWWNNDMHHKWYNVPKRWSVLKRNGIEFSPWPIIQWFSKNIVVEWVDYNELVENTPENRFKFYFSLHCIDDEALLSAEKMLLDIVRRAKEEWLSIAYKIEDHDYDSLLLYTFHQKALSAIIHEIYNSYKDTWIFREVPRIFHWPIQDVNPWHIWWVQEPIWWHLWSHTNRMKLLATKIKWWKSFKEVCEELKINPNAPWLLNL